MDEGHAVVNPLQFIKLWWNRSRWIFYGFQYRQCFWKKIWGLSNDFNRKVNETQGEHAPIITKRIGNKIKVKWYGEYLAFHHRFARQEKEFFASISNHTHGICFVTGEKQPKWNVLQDWSKKTRMYSSRMRTACTLPYGGLCPGGLPNRDPPWQRPPLPDRDLPPPDRDPPGQRPFFHQ